MAGAGVLEGDGAGGCGADAAGGRVDGEGAWVAAVAAGGGGGVGGGVAVDGVGCCRRERDRLVGFVDGDDPLCLRRDEVVVVAGLVGVHTAGAGVLEGHDARCDRADAARGGVDGDHDWVAAESSRRHRGVARRVAEHGRRDGAAERQHLRRLGHRDRLVRGEGGVVEVGVVRAVVLIGGDGARAGVVEADHAAPVHGAGAARAARQRERDGIARAPAGRRRGVEVPHDGGVGARRVRDGLGPRGRHEAHLGGLKFVARVVPRCGVVLVVARLGSPDPAVAVAGDRHDVADDGAHVRGARGEDDRVAGAAAGRLDRHGLIHPHGKVRDLRDRHGLRAPHEHRLLRLRGREVVLVPGLVGVDHAASVVLKADDPGRDRADAARRGVDREHACVAAAAPACRRRVGLPAAVGGRWRDGRERDGLGRPVDGHGLLDLRRRQIIVVAGPVEVDDARAGVAVEEGVVRTVDGASAGRGPVDRDDDRGADVRRAPGGRHVVVRVGAVEGVRRRRRRCERDGLAALAHGDRLLGLRGLAVVDRAGLVRVDHAGADVLEGHHPAGHRADAARARVDGEGDGLSGGAACGRRRVRPVDDGRDRRRGERDGLRGDRVRHGDRPVACRSAAGEAAAVARARGVRGGRAAAGWTARAAGAGAAAERPRATAAVAAAAAAREGARGHEEGVVPAVDAVPADAVGVGRAAAAQRSPCAVLRACTATAAPGAHRSRFHADAGAADPDCAVLDCLRRAGVGDHRPAAGAVGSSAATRAAIRVSGQGAIAAGSLAAGAAAASRAGVGATATTTATARDDPVRRAQAEDARPAPAAARGVLRLRLSAAVAVAEGAVLPGPADEEAEHTARVDGDVARGDGRAGASQRPAAAPAAADRRHPDVRHTGRHGERVGAHCRVRARHARGRRGARARCVSRHRQRECARERHRGDDGAAKRPGHVVRAIWLHRGEPYGGGACRNVSSRHPGCHCHRGTLTTGYWHPDSDWRSAGAAVRWSRGRNGSAGGVGGQWGSACADRR